MQTDLAAFVKDTPEGREAEAILRKCVHCGFCTATCPTYQLLGDELDGPRGRIYLIKEVLEGRPATAKTQLHLDRCLTCRSCETTCPSGVEYGRLIDIGRPIVERQVPRSAGERATRYALSSALRTRPLFDAALSIGRITRSLLPRTLARRVPASAPAGEWPRPRHARRVLILEGCVQPSIAPATDAAMARVLDRIGISAQSIRGGGCCGALPFHLNDHDEARSLARRNIDAWWPAIKGGAEAIVVTASGCGVMLQDYAHLLANDGSYAKRAQRVTDLARDPVEIVGDEWKRIAPLVAMDRGSKRIAFHSPCTLQHGLKLRGRVEELLRAIGHELLPVADAHLCCGSAGTYSILQPEIADKLRRQKLAALQAERPQLIVTANIGCQTHLASGTSRPVRHWIELVDEKMLDATALA
ncbi:MAG TPA: glycolate oxidase subunit GlcF [Casimicrobiaceae bacterium]|nr:glycolate oxidase subunit GlcF [Casimicrobiaceae bacterium]